MAGWPGSNQVSGYVDLALNNLLIPSMLAAQYGSEQVSLLVIDACPPRVRGCFISQIEMAGVNLV